MALRPHLAAGLPLSSVPDGIPLASESAAEKEMGKVDPIAATGDGSHVVSRERVGWK